MDQQWEEVVVVDGVSMYREGAYQHRQSISNTGVCIVCLCTWRMYINTGTVTGTPVLLYRVSMYMEDV